MKKIVLCIMCITGCILFTSCHNDTDTIISNTIDSNHTATNTSAYVSSEIIISESVTTTNMIFQTEKELVQFIAPTINHISEKYPLDFLSDNQVLLFDKATYIYHNFFEIPDKKCFSIVYENYMTGSSGIDYNSFNEYLLSVFSQDFTYTLLNERFPNRFKNKNGELYVNVTDRGSNVLFRNIEFNLIEKTDDMILFNGCAEYYSDENPDISEADKTIIIFNYSLILTENGWRVNEFNYWK